MKISKSIAKQLAIWRQGLDCRWKLPKGKEGVAQTIERMGYVQIDTIAVVQRAHHHTIWSRRPDYTPEMLHELQAQDRRVFEYWAHAASYLPICDYRYYLSRMRAFAGSARERQWLEQNAQVVKNVVDRIRNEGPLDSADFSAPPGTKRGPWWDWKPAKRALETLFSMGELMIAERRNFQRIYDLTERVLPAGIDTSHPDRGELGRFAVRRALASLGFGSPDEMRWGRSNRETISEALAEMSGSGEVTPVEIAELDGGAYYALTEIVEEGTKTSKGRRRLHLLSPFDNLVIRRGRLKQLFDFDYKLECYHPASKRRYGYFCLPILWGDQFVGRLDPKADRDQDTRFVRNLIFERDFKGYDRLIPALAKKLRAFAAFNGRERVVIERTSPGKVRGPLKRELDR